LAAGVSRQDVATEILSTTESRTKMVTDDYFRYLGRAPDDPGVSYWLDQLDRGKDFDNIAVSMISSEEYYQDKTPASSG
jgi:hypothetical protein